MAIKEESEDEPKKGEPKNEDGNNVVVSATTAWKALGTVLAAAILGVTSFTLLTLIDLKTTTATLTTDQRNLSDKINSVYEEVKRNRDTAETLKLQVHRLELIADRLERRVSTEQREVPR